MNNTNPFIPQGSLTEQKNKQRARFKKAVIWVLALNFALLIPGLLIQGCKDKEATADNQTSMTPTNTPDIAMTTDTNTIAQPLSNTVAVLPQPVTNIVATPTPVPPLAGNPTTYKIQSGDSFYTLSKKFHVSMKAIEAANPGVDSKKLQINKEINIPAATVPAASPTPTVAANGAATPDASDMYVVKPRENLTIIAKAHGTTAKAIMAANSLKSDRIKAGDKLKMPAAKTATATPTAADPIPTRAAVPTTPVSTSGTQATIR